MARLNKELAALCKRNADLGKQAKSAEAERAALRAQIDEVTKEKEAIDARRAAQAKALSDVRGRNADLEQQVKAALTEQSDLRGQIKELTLE